LRAKKTDYLKENLLEFLKQGPKNLDQCVEEGGNMLKRMGIKTSSSSDEFRMRVFEKLHQLKAIGYVNKDRTVKPAVFSAAESA
jgi:hypothetical protein